MAVTAVPIPSYAPLRLASHVAYMSQDIRAAAAAAVATPGGPAAHADTRTLTHFWNRQSITSSLGLSTAGGSQRQQQQKHRPAAAAARGRMASGGGAQVAALLAASRYLSDFQELRRLGKGGFGVVVAAVNRWGLIWGGRLGGAGWEEGWVGEEKRTTKAPTCG